jgi:hypothetical protein
LPTWIDIVIKLTPALITLGLGSIGAWIALNQHRIARDKLRLDLFEKRFNAYRKLQEYFVVLFREGAVTPEALATLWKARAEAVFLFDHEIQMHFDEVLKIGMRLQELRRKLYGPKALPVGQERSRGCDEDSELLKWNMDQMEKSPARFARYLRFS